MDKLDKYEFYLGGDNADHGSRFSRARVVEFLGTQGIKGATLIETYGVWQGNQECSWLVVVFLPNNRDAAREIARSMAQHFNQYSVGLVGPSNEAEIIDA